VDTVRVSTKGQVVIPKWVRERLGLHEGIVCRVEITREGYLADADPSGPGLAAMGGGVLAGTDVLKEHLEEHRREVAAEGHRP